jgi:hypothetical protein
MTTDDFRQTMAFVSEMIDNGRVDDELLGDLELPVVLGEIASLVSNELMHLSGLGEDPEQNESQLRTLVQQAANKAFFAGLAIGTARGGYDNQVILPVLPDQLEQIALGAIRDGVLQIQLVAATPESPE